MFRLGALTRRVRVTSVDSSIRERSIVGLVHATGAGEIPEWVFPSSFREVGALTHTLAGR